VARIRTIKPEFWEDEGVAALSRDARLLWIATWNHADDEGILRWSPDYIKAQVFPYDADLTVAKVAKLMTEVVEGDFVYPYRSGRVHQQLALIIRFRKHQRINRPQEGRLPGPPLADPPVRRMYGRRDGMICGICGERIEEVTDGYVNPYDPSPPGNRYHQQHRQRLSIDHILPVSKGGSDLPSNLRASHMSCNIGRNNRMTPDEIRDYEISDDELGSVNDSATHSVNDSLNDSSVGDDAFTAGRGKEGEHGSGSGRDSPETRRSSRARAGSRDLGNKGTREVHTDAQRLCDLLASLVREGGSKAVISDQWLTDMDRLLRIDGPDGNGREPDKVERMIRWSQADSFWKANVRSPRALRKHYDPMRLQANERAAAANGKTSHREPGSTVHGIFYPDAPPVYE
jgi:HNH endonuclease